MQNAQVLVKYEERNLQNKQLFISSWMRAITTRDLGDYKCSKIYGKRPHPYARILLQYTCVDSVELCTKQTVDNIEISVRMKIKENSCH